MSSVRPPANGEPAHPSGGSRWPGADPLVLAALAATASGALFGALGIATGSVWLSLAGVALASVMLGLAAAAFRKGQRAVGAGAPPEAWFRTLGFAAVLIVGVFSLAITASATDITDGGQTLVRVTGWLALTIAFAAFGFSFAMGRTEDGRRRPDWVFVSIAVLLIGFTLVVLARRLELILLFT
jgi:hypothetical protein